MSSIKKRRNKIMREAVLSVVVSVSILVSAAPGARCDEVSRAVQRPALPAGISCSVGDFALKSTGKVFYDSPVFAETARDVIRDNNLRTIEQYADWVSGNIRFKKDLYSDTWLAPDRLIRKGYGDCEDMAFLSRSVLRSMGHKPRVIAYKRAGWRQWHAICVFERQGRYCYMDNARLKKTGASSFEEFLGLLKPEGEIIMMDGETADEAPRDAMNLTGIVSGNRIVKRGDAVSIVAR
jgi:predicted transglutaminase-like cysteine proteinase